MEKPRTRTEKDKVEKKIYIAIDKIIDIQDMGYGNNSTERILENLRHLMTELVFD